MAPLRHHGGAGAPQGLRPAAHGRSGIGMAKPLYESDVTRMVRELLQNKPQIAEEQRKGRSMWWDKRLDADEQRRFGQSRVAQKGYVYQTDS